MSSIPIWVMQLCMYSVISVLVIFAYTDERSIDVEGGWLWSWAEGMDLVPIVGRGFPCASSPTPPHLHLPCGTALVGGEGTEHCVIEGINWWHLFWCTWPKQLASCQRPSVCHCWTSEKTAIYVIFFFHIWVHIWLHKPGQFFVKLLWTTKLC